jgi:phosphoglycolate phosphatase-like HAD superfamily hydrolase
MIKTVLWDFDGVILDSMKIKGEGFVSLFKEFDDKYLIEIERYHYANGGVSRFEKIRYFYKNIVKQPVDEERVMRLADDFSKIILKDVSNKNNLIKETVRFIQNNYKKYNFHIVSGSEHNELNNICQNFKLNHYFLSINGSPTKKNDLVKKIINQYEYSREEVALIGDAMTDYNASIENKIRFYGYNNIELKRLGYYIDTFTGFKV